MFFLTTRRIVIGFQVTNQLKEANAQGGKKLGLFQKYHRTALPSSLGDRSSKTRGQNKNQILSFPYLRPSPHLGTTLLQLPQHLTPPFIDGESMWPSSTNSKFQNPGDFISEGNSRLSAPVSPKFWYPKGGSDVRLSCNCSRCRDRDKEKKKKQKMFPTSASSAAVP